VGFARTLNATSPAWLRFRYDPLGHDLQVTPVAVLAQALPSELLTFLQHWGSFGLWRPNGKAFQIENLKFDIIHRRIRAAASNK
jgi:hypothetical protein